MFRFALSLCVALSSTAAAAADLNFCWRGANGYTMTGKMAFPDRLMSNAVLTEDHLQSFKISGYYKGQLLGTWNMREATKATTFHVRFDPIGMTFLTGGSFPQTHSQGWNADGAVADCGSPGFGFNSGNYAQDICVNGTWIADSSIDPATPMIVTEQPVTPACTVTPAVSKAQISNH